MAVCDVDRILCCCGRLLEIAGQAPRAIDQHSEGRPHPELRGQPLVAFALAMRLDISAEAAVLLLRRAPDLHTVDAVSAWVDAIPAQPKPETRH